MGILSYEELEECIDEIITYLEGHEDDFWVPLEVAHQLKGEIVQIIAANE